MSLRDKLIISINTDREYRRKREKEIADREKEEKETRECRLKNSRKYSE